MWCLFLGAERSVTAHETDWKPLSQVEHVCLWLGANVMMEFTFEEAESLLNKNLKTATENLAGKCHKTLNPQTWTTTTPGPPFSSVSPVCIATPRFLAKKAPAVKTTLPSLPRTDAGLSATEICGSSHIVCLSSLLLWTPPP